MSKIGLNNFRFSPVEFRGENVIRYLGAYTPAKAISCNVSITNNSADLYADDSLAESDTSFQSGTVTMGIDNDDLETMATLLGHTYTSADGIVRSSEDVAPYVGLGRVVTRMINGVYSYKVEIILLVRFSEPSQTDNTRGESVEFGTTEIEGTIVPMKNGTWSLAKVFSNKQDAIIALNNLFNGGFYPPRN